MWVKDPRCDAVVNQSWQEGLNKFRGSQFKNCIDTCREQLKVWNKVEFGHVGRRIANLQNWLQMLESCQMSSTTEEEIQEVRRNLNIWLVAESTMWKQRSRNTWLVCGDCNTSFFHAKSFNWF